MAAILRPQNLFHQSGIVIRFDNLDQNKALANHCSNFCARDIIA